MRIEEIINIANSNNGYLTPQIIKQNKIEYTYISRLLKKNILIKVASGVYITDQGVEDVFYINSVRFSKLVYSGDTAIFLNGLSNKQYPDYEATVPYGANFPKVEGFVIKQSRKESFYLGIVEIETPFGNKVRCYDKERCICDLFIRPDNYDYEDRVYAINTYKNNCLKFDKLYDYAKKLGVYEKVKNVFEVVGWN